MNEIDEAINKWQNGDYINPDALKFAFDAVSLLNNKVKELEEAINQLQTNQI
jgi:hypothetical protein